jgi:hypothetical protein
MRDGRQERTHSSVTSDKPHVDDREKALEGCLCRRTMGRGRRSARAERQKTAERRKNRKSWKKIETHLKGSNKNNGGRRGQSLRYQCTLVDSPRINTANTRREENEGGEDLSPVRRNDREGGEGKMEGGREERRGEK